MSEQDDNDRVNHKRKLIAGVLLGLLALIVFITSFIARIQHG